jgi:protein-arginine kinase activator protein McsA
MTNEEMERLADLIVKKIIEQQNEIDKAFFEGMNEAIDKGHEFTVESQEDILLGELARLQTMLAKYEHEEHYEKAGIIANKIKWLENKISKL